MSSEISSSRCIEMDTSRSIISNYNHRAPAAHAWSESQSKPGRVETRPKSGHLVSKSRHDSIIRQSLTSEYVATRAPHKLTKNHTMVAAMYPQASLLLGLHWGLRGGVQMGRSGEIGEGVPEYNEWEVGPWCDDVELTPPEWGREGF